MIFAALRSLASLRELRLAHQSRKKARSRQARQTERHCVMLKQHFSRGALVARLAVAILLVSPAALAQKRDAFRIDYKASVLALNKAKITSDFAFFTGTELFLEAARHRTSPSTVRFELPPEWKLVSALKQTSDP